MRFLLRILLVLSVSSILIHPGEYLHATTVRLVSLDQMVKAADRIFVGKCVSVESRRDEYGLPATYVTFVVIERIKGPVGGKITIKQIGAGTFGALKIPGLPTYAVGEEVLLFLHPNSQYGFTSPVGLHQGKWRVLESSPGKKMLQRSFGGSVTFKGAAGRSYGAEQRRGLFDYSRFLTRLKEMIRQ